MKIKCIQMNPTLGDFQGNGQKILQATIQASNKGVDLIIFPECALFGYYPADLLERPSVVQQQIQTLQLILKKFPKNICVLLGAISKNPKSSGKPFLNSVLYIKNQTLVKAFSKTLLTNYDIFDETRHFEKGNIEKNIFSFKGHKILVSICEDIWAWPIHKRNIYSENLFSKIKKKVDLHINLSASPFTLTKTQQRKSIFKSCCKKTNSPMIYINQVGAQDETIFDGGSAIIDEKGSLIWEAQPFKEQNFTINFTSSVDKIYVEKTEIQDFKISESYKYKKDNGSPQIPFKEIPLSSSRYYKIKKNSYPYIHDALILGIKDFSTKTGLGRAHLGLSGGIDSALVYYLACQALGTKYVSSIALPTQFNSSKSLKLAQNMCKNLNSELMEFPIQSLYEAFKKEVDSKFNISSFGLIHENLQARIRANILMAYSNIYNSLLLSTSNKTELAVGYSTLYGDLCGGLCPIGDLTKTQVYGLCQFINKDKEIIPYEILDRPPSAELRSNQKDTDSLPDYKKLDASVKNLVELYKAPCSKTDHWALNALVKSEFKRWQAPPILKITDHAFGQGRRFPIAHKAVF